MCIFQDLRTIIHIMRRHYGFPHIAFNAKKADMCSFITTNLTGLSEKYRSNLLTTTAFQAAPTAVSSTISPPVNVPTSAPSSNTVAPTVQTAAVQAGGYTSHLTFRQPSSFNDSSAYEATASSAPSVVYKNASRPATAAATQGPHYSTTSSAPVSQPGYSAPRTSVSAASSSAAQSSLPQENIPAYTQSYVAPFKTPASFRTSVPYTGTRVAYATTTASAAPLVNSPFRHIAPAPSAPSFQSRSYQIPTVSTSNTVTPVTQNMPLNHPLRHLTEHPALAAPSVRAPHFECQSVLAVAAFSRRSPSSSQCLASTSVVLSQEQQTLMYISDLILYI